MPHITFVHGILNKPREDILRRAWKRALSDEGFDLDSSGVTASMVYWADLLYPKFADPSGYQNASDELLISDEDSVELQSWIDGLEGDEKIMVEGLMEKWRLREEDLVDEVYQPVTPQPGGGFQAIPLPSGLEKLAMAVLLKDVHHYLFNVEYSPDSGPKVPIQTEIRKRFVDDLNANRPADDVHVVIGHSMGAVIVYDCLKNVNECPGVTGIVTLGAPLGLSEVYNHFRPPYQRDYAYPSGKAKSWSNFSAWGDIVALDRGLRQEYRENGVKVVDDEMVWNPGLWKHHSHDYLAQHKVIQRLRKLTNRV
ncbi:MAG: hypothetical protein AAGA96_16340 [Verrucomicrobiota bacterium]